MAKITIHLEEKEHTALSELALREYRTLQAQAAIIIHRQLKNLGLLASDAIDKELSADPMLQNPVEG